MINNKTLKVSIFVSILAVFGAFCQAQETKTPEELFVAGNSYYEKDEYTKAISEYNKILAQGYESGPVYYNIADAYFKSGKLGKAILNYKRAKRLMPRDADLAANYKFAMAKVQAKITPNKGIWAWSPLRIFSENFTINELSLLASGMYVVIVFLLFIAAIRSQRSGYLKLAIMLISICFVITSAVLWRKASRGRSGGVVVVSRAEALFGPFDSATKFFTLHEGVSVTILKSKADWYKVRRTDGKVGWVKKNAIERICPEKMTMDI